MVELRGSNLSRRRRQRTTLEVATTGPANHYLHRVCDEAKQMAKFLKHALIHILHNYKRKLIIHFKQCFSYFLLGGLGDWRKGTLPQVRHSFLCTAGLFLCSLCFLHQHLLPGQVRMSSNKALLDHRLNYHNDRVICMLSEQNLSLRISLFGVQC